MKVMKQVMVAMIDDQERRKKPMIEMKPMVARPM
jgi:hypothetical protein